MRSVCVWAIVVAGLWLMASGASAETMIEVDENGDEYELKRFYIQGRQLKGDGSQSQCVVTRRKRSSRGLSQAGVSVSSQTLNVESLPQKEHREGAGSAAGAGAGAEAGAGLGAGGVALVEGGQPSNKHRYVAFTGVHLEPAVPSHNDDDDDEDMEDDDEDMEEDLDELQPQQQSSPKADSHFVPAALALPLASATSGSSSVSTSSSQSHLNQGVSVVANAASHANVAEDAGIVVVQSHQPPKVNPDTHAVFELKPVQADSPLTPGQVSFYPFVHPWETVDHGEDYDGDEDYDEEDYDDFYYGNGYYRDQPGYYPLGEYDEEVISEHTPTTTTAVWSTGDDDSDIHPVINQANKRPNQNKKPNKNKNNKNKQKNPNQKNKKRVQQQKKRKEQAEKEQAEQDLAEEQQQLNKRKKDQKKRPEMEQQQDETDEPVVIIKKPTSDSSLAQSQSSSSSSSSSISSGSNMSSSSSSSSMDKKKKKKKKRPSSSSSSSSSSTSIRRKKKKPSSSSSSNISNSNKRRRPSSNISSSSSNIGGYRRRRPQQSTQELQQRRRRRQKQQEKQQKQQQKQQKRRRQQQEQQQQKRRRQQQQRRRRNRNQNRQFYGNEPIINCIYINKDPVTTTTTTPRPFWNILGRQSPVAQSSPAGAAKDAKAGQEVLGADAVDPVAEQAVLQTVRRQFGDFGGRKRSNLRFVS